MERKKRWLFFTTFVLSTLAVAFLSASMGTDYWVVASPVRIVNEAIIGGAKNVTQGDLKTKFKGHINFGLFHGYKELDHGLGVRKGEVWIYCIGSKNLCGWVGTDFGAEESGKEEILRIISEYDAKVNSNVSTLVTEHGLFNFGMWVSTILFVALAIVWGLVSMGFAMLNASIRPIETVTGPMGLYLWNTLALLFTLLALVLYVVLYFADLRSNVLSPEDIDNYQWTSKDKAVLSYSFYFLVVSSVLYLINIFIVALSGVECGPVRYRSTVSEKALDGVMMY